MITFKFPIFVNSLYFSIMKIVAFTGSLDPESYAVKLMKTLVILAPPIIDFKILDIGGLPCVYETPAMTQLPDIRNFLTEIESADSFIIVTAEYKRSYAPALKNALDMGLLHSDNTWREKTVAVIGCTPFGPSAFRGFRQLEVLLEGLFSRIFFRPDYYLYDTIGKFNSLGELSDSPSINLLENFWEEFIKWLQPIPTAAKLRKNDDLLNSLN